MPSHFFYSLSLSLFPSHISLSICSVSTLFEVLTSAQSCYLSYVSTLFSKHLFTHIWLLYCILHKLFAFTLHLHSVFLSFSLSLCLAHFLLVFLARKPCVRVCVGVCVNVYRIWHWFTAKISNVDNEFFAKNVYFIEQTFYFPLCSWLLFWSYRIKISSIEIPKLSFYIYLFIVKQCLRSTVHRLNDAFVFPLFCWG